MNVNEQDLLSYLKSKLIYHKENLQSGSSLDPFFESRIDYFLQDMHERINIEKLEDSVLKSQLFQVNCLLTNIGVHTFVLACHDEEGVMWLDNHVDNADFYRFLRLEALFRLYSDNVTFLTQKLLKTKFAYLLHPVLIQNVSDIPFKTLEELKPTLDSMEERQRVWHEEFYGNQISKLKKIETLIKPPRIDKSKEIDLEFFVWTYIGGFVIKTTCKFSNQDFTSDFVIIDKSVGDLVMMR